MKKIWFILIAFLTPFSQAAELPYFTKNDFTPIWKVPKGAAQIERFILTNHKGEPITERTFKNKITVVNFFFASCGGICPTMMSTLAGTYAKMADIKDLQMISFTVTPQLDTPEKLRAFAAQRRLDTSRWHLVTGDSGEIYRVAERVFLANKDVPSKKPGEFVHSENAFLIDQDGYIRGIYSTRTAAEMDLLVKDAKALAGVRLE